MAFVTVLEITRPNTTVPFFGDELAPGANTAARAAMERLRAARQAAGYGITEETSNDNLTRRISIDYGTRANYEAFNVANKNDRQIVREARNRYFAANSITATFTMPT
jgi:hypothetical protein